MDEQTPRQAWMGRHIAVLAIWSLFFGILILLLPLVTLLPAGYGVAPSEMASSPVEEVVTTLPATDGAAPSEIPSPPDDEMVTTLPATDGAAPSEIPSPPVEEMRVKPTPTAKVGNSVGNLAPDFALKTINGQSITLSHLQGKKILLNFWSTHCGACIVGFPLIRATYDEYGRNSGDVAVITVCIDARVDRIKKIEAKYGDKYGSFDFPILLDEETATKDNYHIWALPTTVFIDSDGIIQRIKPGRFHSQEEIESILESL